MGRRDVSRAAHDSRAPLALAQRRGASLIVTSSLVRSKRILAALLSSPVLLCGQSSVRPTARCVAR